MLIKACLNGSCAPGEHPLLPRTPQDLALATIAVARRMRIEDRG